MILYITFLNHGKCFTVRCSLVAYFVYHYKAEAYLSCSQDNRLTVPGGLPPRPFLLQGTQRTMYLRVKLEKIFFASKLAALHSASFGCVICTLFT